MRLLAMELETKEVIVLDGSEEDADEPSKKRPKAQAKQKLTKKQTKENTPVRKPLVIRKPGLCLRKWALYSRGG